MRTHWTARSGTALAVILWAIPAALVADVLWRVAGWLEGREVAPGAAPGWAVFGLWALMAGSWWLRAKKAGRLKGERASD